MRPFLCFLSVLLLLPLAASAGEIVRDYPADRVTDDVYVIHGPAGYPSVENQGFMNNPAFVLTETGVVVIDPGSSLQAGRMVLKQLRGITDKPVTHVLITHVHGDHWLGNHAVEEAFPEAQILALPQTIQLAQAGQDTFWLNLMHNATDGFTAGTKAVLPEQPIDVADELHVGGKTFRFYAPAKAHSNTDVMIELVEDSVLFAGDNLLNQRLARMDDGTFRGSIEACNVAEAIDATHVVPGHGPTGGNEIPGLFRRYLETVYGEAGRLYEQGLPDYEMKAVIVDQLADYQDWANFEDEIGKHISLAVLEYERAMFE
ncbi:MAG: MBL fold metallo-hydrolase [Gammaproteobacteria bacterium]|nr:MBL fold metallo-hydrolase [Gammaproteobacteria bacterium]MDX5375386.1 MBL fold metallo-hydrolase [Gammaproteobacteria bacterium]